MSGDTLSTQVSNQGIETVQPLLYSCIDIGTNSVKLLTADLGPSYPARVYERSIISRLGEGMRPESRGTRAAGRR